jgi:hypothetical protein
VISHERKGKGAWKGRPAGEQSGQKEDHRDRKKSEDQGDDPQISFRDGKRVEEVSDHVKQGRVKVGRPLFVIVKLRLEAIPRILISIDFVEP